MSASSWTATAAGRRGAGLSRLRGHEAGVEAIRRVVEAAPEQGVGTLTLYAFSSDNWRRPKAEVVGADGAAAILSRQRDRQPGAQRRSAHRDRPPRSPSRRHRRTRSRAPKRPPPPATRCICASRSTIPPATRSSTPRRRPPASAISPARASPNSSPARPTCATSISSSAPAARSGCRTSCSGKAPTPSCISPSGCGPNSTRDDLAEALGAFHRRERRFGGLQAIAPEEVASL